MPIIRNTDQNNGDSNMCAKAMEPAEPIGSKIELNAEGMATITFMISLLAEFSLGVILAGSGIIALIACAGY